MILDASVEETHKTLYVDLAQMQKKLTLIQIPILDLIVIVIIILTMI
jgi:hypothetical protein